MSVVEELIYGGNNGSISFGNYELDKKTKRTDYEFEGNVYKVKTFRDITRLERNETVLYESVPGTAVHDLRMDENGIVFSVEGNTDVQITLGMEDDTEYDVEINGKDAGTIRTMMGGKLPISVDLSETHTADVRIRMLRED